MPLTHQEINRRHTYHPPRGEGDRDDHQFVRDRVRVLAEDVDSLFAIALGHASGREQALFHTALEEASAWAHAALARGRAQ